MTTQIDICNLALGKLGDEAVVSSVTPPYQSMQAQYCALFYPQALQVLLTKHDWAFATVTAALTQAATSLTSSGSIVLGLPTSSAAGFSREFVYSSSAGGWC